MNLQELQAVEELMGDHLCRFALTNAAPHQFCGEPALDGKAYCKAHHKRTFGGIGKDWQALAGMMEATEQSIVKASEVNRERPETAAVDVELRENTL